MKSTDKTKTNELIIGTRGSLLAVTQSTLLKNELESKNPIKLDLKKIKTQGDQIIDKPLWQLEGKDFFTKELDIALLKEEVNFVIHSYKDLGSERPEGIKLGAITKRKYPHDILLIKKKTIKELSNRQEFIVGTSSPRRIVNTENGLNHYIAKNAKISCKMLRGNVNSRIEKLINDEYDAIILAYAGLERLASYPESAKVLKELMQDLNFMVLPVKDFPPASSQGALAVEYSEKFSDQLLPILETVNCLETRAVMEKERSIFASYGGGCHLAVGIHTKKVHDYFVTIEKGISDKKHIFKTYIEGIDYSILKNKSVYIMNKENDFLLERQKIVHTPKTSEQSHLFVTSSHCFHNISNAKTIWSSGNTTMTKLIEAGHWVNGSAEGFGHAEIENFSNSNLVKILYPDINWMVLSHDNASIAFGQLLPSYKHNIINTDGHELVTKLLESEAIYWASEIQFKNYIQKYPELEKRTHITGLGKTYTALKSYKPLPVIDIKHLEKIIKG